MAISLVKADIGLPRLLSGLFPGKRAQLVEGSAGELFELVER